MRVGLGDRVNDDRTVNTGDLLLVALRFGPAGDVGCRIMEAPRRSSLCETARPHHEPIVATLELRRLARRMPRDESDGHSSPDTASQAPDLGITGAQGAGWTGVARP